MRLQRQSILRQTDKTGNLEGDTGGQPHLLLLFVLLM